MQAGLREVWTSSHGRAGRYHVAIENGVAACSPAKGMRDGNRRIVLGDLLDADEVPMHLRCARPACAKRWPKAVP